MSAYHKPAVLTLSVIIVNYNVKYFLEQCLYSVEKAGKGLDMEVLIVDNASTDGSVPYLQELFPWCRFMINEVNVGFGKACNQGLAQAGGDFILFLNPDTLLAEDSLTICMNFLQEHPKAGALGVKMIDGTGRFLRESKRSFPSPLTSFYKLTGLASIFPRSRTFGKYHLGHKDKNKDHEVDVLAGAFMMVRKEILDRIGSFDEQFFMYGEDVDLSYRIQKAGYQNWYLASTSIIHFKGESTKRGSLNYVRLFYKAMSVFVQKHYGGTRAGVFTASIQAAIWMRALVTAAARFFRWIRLPFIDALLILLSFFLVKEFWIHYVRTDIAYPETVLLYALPGFTVLYLLVAYYAGLYDTYYKMSNLLRATLVATIGLLAVYSLLPESYRFSRGIVLFGGLLAFVMLSGIRLLLIFFGVLKMPAELQLHPQLVAVASRSEYEALAALLDKHQLKGKLLGRIASNGLQEADALSRLEALQEAVAVLAAKEVLFCAGSLSYKNIIVRTEELCGKARLRYHRAGSGSIVGSDASTASGEIIAEESYQLQQASLRRTKRLIDVSCALFFLLTFPIHLLLVKQPGRFFRHAVQVLAGKRTWIGYSTQATGLPRLRPAVAGPNGLVRKHHSGLSEETLRKADYLYAKEYEPVQDLKAIWKSYPWLGMPGG